MFNFIMRLDIHDGGHHSGNWGGLLTNPGVIMAHAIASMIDKNGKILVEGWRNTKIPSSVRLQQLPNWKSVVVKMRHRLIPIGANQTCLLANASLPATHSKSALLRQGIQNRQLMRSPHRQWFMGIYDMWLAQMLTN